MESSLREVGKLRNLDKDLADSEDGNRRWGEGISIDDEQGKTLKGPNAENDKMAKTSNT